MKDKPVTISSLLQFTSRLIPVLLWQVKGKKAVLAIERSLQMVCFGGPMVSHSFSGTKSTIWVLSVAC